MNPDVEIIIDSDGEEAEIITIHSDGGEDIVMIENEDDVEEMEQNNVLGDIPNNDDENEEMLIQNEDQGEEQIIEEEDIEVEDIGYTYSIYIFVQAGYR